MVNGNISDGIDGIHWGACGGESAARWRALNVLVRARDVNEAEARLWQALQLHLEFPQFYEFCRRECACFAET